MSRTRRLRCRARCVRCCALVALVLPWLVGGALRAESEPPEPSGPGRSPAIEIGDEETTYIEAPPFPGAVDDQLRVQLGTWWLPDASFGDGTVDLVQPVLRLRGNLPVLDLFVLRVNGIFGTSHYEFSDGARFGALEKGDFVLYRTAVSADAALRLNPDDWSLFEEGEVWSLLGRLAVGSEFERDAFDEGLSTTGSIGVGYRNGDVFRLAVGAAISTSIEEAGLDVTPLLSARWRPTPRLTVSDRGLGLRIAYQVWPSLELFAGGHRNSDEYALKSRPGNELPLFDGIVLGAGRLDDLAFRDRQWQVGGGFEWKYTRAFRVNVEAGAVVHRKLRLHSDDLGTLYSERGDPSAYAGVRFELRR